jgi:dipeptidyl aminopeptidase/acylaminoacyl peptidase
VDDLLQRESFGAIAPAAGGRFVLVEQRGPYASAARFDRLLYNDLFRTRIMVGDLARSGGLVPLFPPTPGHGYRLGPLSPDGRWAVVHRLTNEAWDLGLVDVAAGHVRWLPITPEQIGGARGLQWVSPSSLAVIARPDGDLPHELRWMTPQAALPQRWAASASGGVSVTAIGSGRHLAVRPRPPVKRLLIVCARTGAVRTLVEGDFVDVEASEASGRIALLEAAEDIPLAKDHPVQGPYGMATRRLRLVLADVRTGQVRRPCPKCDMLSGLLSWSPGGEALLAYARADGEAWTEGRLVKVDGRTGTVRPVGAALRAVVERRPEVVYGGWWGNDPLVFARPAAGERADWWRLGAEGPVRLTGALASPPREGLTVTPRALLVAGDGAAWRIDPAGRARRLTSAPFEPVRRRTEGVPGRAALAPAPGEAISGVLERPVGPQFVRFGAGGAMSGRTGLPGPRTALVDAGPGAGVLVVRVDGGGRETLEQRKPRSHPRILATINVRLRDVVLPRVVPVPHRGPGGEALVSWILLPWAGAPLDAAPPPLIVLPYPGETWPRRPEHLLLSHPPFFPAAPLTGQGYAVLLPSLPARRADQGPAVGLADEVLAIVDAAARQPDLQGAFDPHRLGLWGHSFGGFAVLAILTQTDRFDAAVAQAAPSNLASLHGTFSPGKRVHADEGASTYSRSGWVEALQGDMRAPPWADLDRYVRNSPALQADRIGAPVMLVHGEMDNFPISQAEEMFSQLFRQGKDALLVTYWGEGHHYASPGNLRDLYTRLFAWYQRHLSEVTPAGAEPSERPGSATATSGPKPPPPPQR